MKLPENIDIVGYELILSEDCNLRCKYCFDGYFSDREIKCGKDNVMDIDMIPNIIHFIKKTMSKDKKVNFNFFGGEPLTNWKFFQMLVMKMRETFGYEKIDISTVTNATLLTTEKIDFLKAFKVGVAISLDGVEKANINRIDKGGNPVWDKVVKILPEAISKMGDVNLMMVVNGDNYKELYDSYKFLLRFGVEVEILVDFHTDWMSDEVLDEIYSVYEKLFLQEGNTLFRSLKKYINPDYLKMNDFCGNANNTISINPRGGIYFCHQFTSTLNSSLDKDLPQYGNIIDGFVDTDTFDQFNKRTCFVEWSKETKCNSCSIKNWCKGGCMGEHYSYEGKKDLQNINPNICKYHLMLDKIITKLKLS